MVREESFEDDAAREPVVPLLRKPRVTTLFDAGLARIGRDGDPFLFRGALVSEAGRSCRYELDLARGAIARIQFRASPCISLIAYAEWTSQYLEGWPTERALLVTREDLLKAVPEIRNERHLRADLVVRALHSATTVALAFEARFAFASHAKADCVAWSI